MSDSFFDVPAGMRDADIETAGLQRLGRLQSILSKRGICMHGWSKGDAPCLCLHCNKEFPTFNAMIAERNEIIAEYR